MWPSLEISKAKCKTTVDKDLEADVKGNKTAIKPGAGRNVLMNL